MPIESDPMNSWTVSADVYCSDDSNNRHQIWKRVVESQRFMVFIFVARGPTAGSRRQSLRHAPHLCFPTPQFIILYEARAFGPLAVKDKSIRACYSELPGVHGFDWVARNDVKLLFREANSVGTAQNGDHCADASKKNLRIIC